MPGPYDKFQAAFEVFQEEIKQEIHTALADALKQLPSGKPASIDIAALTEAISKSVRSVVTEELKHIPVPPSPELDGLQEELLSGIQSMLQKALKTLPTPPAPDVTKKDLTTTQDTLRAELFQEIDTLRQELEELRHALFEELKQMRSSINTMAQKENEQQEHIIHRQNSLSKPLGAVADEPQEVVRSRGGERILWRGRENVGVPPMFRDKFGSPPPVANPCPSCGTQNRPDAVYCIGCGQRLAAAPQQSRQLVTLDDLDEEQAPPRTVRLAHRPQSRPLIQRPQSQLIEDVEEDSTNDFHPERTTDDTEDFRW